LDVWGEGASDLWGRLEEDDERELELLDAVRARLRDAAANTAEEDLAGAELEAA
jgi:hypothetical protein